MDRQVIELTATGRSSEILPYDAMDVRDWQRRTRIVYAAPPCLLATYMPLASKVFCSVAGARELPPAQVVAVGDLGLNFGLDVRHQPCVSVEAAALYQLVTQTPGVAEAVPSWLHMLRGSWSAGMALVLFSGATGWRGAFAEHRLWSALALRDGDTIRTPYAKPTVRGWFPPVVLQDLEECVGKAKVARITAAVSELGFEGCPDLILWRRHELWAVEVKSESDTLKEKQRAMMKRLWKLGVRCQVCTPASALKRLAQVVAAEVSSESDASD